MGNAASCAPLIISGNGVAKVLFSDGSLQVYTKPVKAGELMLENPGQFVCQSYSLKVGQRILGLSPDEDLELRQFYFLLPMELLYSVLTDEEMNALADKASRALKNNNKQGNSNNFGRIFPVLSEFCMFPSETVKRTATALYSSPPPEDEPEPVEKYSKQRSWRPALETIVES
ncbi:DUF4228 domain protein [Melia azedarach]|uniref:DUF4228 domain protein n=1 Tax=Melia azedarach TaxID=155640 RepID=A0ACC1XRJ9_MELAZ|nr:DUF4228 domain protein [Melia azedarach]